MRSLGILLLRAAAISLFLTQGVLANNADGSCSKDTPCDEGCCGASGYCGYGPKYCDKGCLSNCDAQAECGEFAPNPGQKCPLNVCCSEFGFCGTTADFCEGKCQSNCDKPKKPSCSTAGGSAYRRTIGYWESWSTTRPCDAWSISDIDANKWTHLNFAFALIDKTTFGVAQMAPTDVQQYIQLTDLKRENPSLKVFISIGGWSAGGAVFSDMTSTSANRGAFIHSLQSFMKQYAFDGVDIDWEYPAAEDRGGDKADYKNFVIFLKELRAALGSKSGITATLPSSYWYLQHFDIAGMERYLDWFNMMSTWDGANKFTKKVVQAHTNLTEIDQGLDLLWRNNIDSKKVVLGLGFYGRAFTLQDPNCSKPGCPFSGGAKKGRCTGESGILSNSEIQDVIAQKKVTPTLVEKDAIKYITWDSDQWVSYDDDETLRMKRDYANELCLGGTMIWALDLDKPGADTSVNNLVAPRNNLDSKWNTLSSKRAVVRSNAMTLGLFWTSCQPMGGANPCPTNYRPLVWGHGKVFDADLNHLTGDGCHGGGVNGYQRALCAAANIEPGKLLWGPGGKSKACNSKCPRGWVTLTKNSHITGQKRGCASGKYAPLCAYGMIVQRDGEMCYPTYSSHILSGGFSQAVDLEGKFDFEIVGGPAGGPGRFGSNLRRRSRRSDIRKRQFGGLNGGDGCGNMLAPGFLGIGVPAQFHRNIRGNYRWDDLEPRTSATSDPPSSTKPPKSTTTVTSTVTEYSTEKKTCDGDRYPQACYHYSSVIVRNPLKKWSLLTCPNADANANTRTLPEVWNSGHTNKEWRSYIASYYHVNNKGPRKSVNPEAYDKRGKRKPPGWGCQRDEWPPALFQQGEEDGFIRYLPAGENGGVANNKKTGWTRFCNFPPKQRVGPVQGGPIANGVVTQVVTVYVTLNVMSYTWKNVKYDSNDPYGLTSNVCRPSVLTADVGYAIFTDDPWYGKVRISDYNFDPGQKAYNVQVPQYKRSPELQDVPKYVDGNMIIDNGNSSRHLSREELEELGYSRCKTPDCKVELEIIQANLDSADSAPDQLPTVEATASYTSAHPTSTIEHYQPGSKPTLQASVTAQPTTAYSRDHGRRHRHHKGHHHHG